MMIFQSLFQFVLCTTTISINLHFYVLNKLLFTMRIVYIYLLYSFLKSLSFPFSKAIANYIKTNRLRSQGTDESLKKQKSQGTEKTSTHISAVNKHRRKATSQGKYMTTYIETCNQSSELSYGQSVSKNFLHYPS